ncbi:MAG: hypothetical protein HY869_22885 [Chloroflexi bacterium]|nr:hypothetical protein [Chloroflexota bacterium]
MPEEKKRKYQSETMGVPPLQMVLVHVENDRANRTRRPLPRKKLRNQDDRERQELIIRLIENLEKE